MARTREQMIEMSKLGHASIRAGSQRKEKLAEEYLQTRVAHNRPCPTIKDVNDYVKAHDPSGASIAEAKGLDHGAIGRLILKYYPDRARRIHRPPDLRQVEIPIPRQLPPGLDTQKAAAIRGLADLIRRIDRIEERITNLQSDATKTNAMLVRLLAERNIKVAE